MSNSTHHVRCGLQPPPCYMPFVQDAMARFAYLYPSVSVKTVPEGLLLEGEASVEPDVLKQEFMFALYRQKIYSETLPLRQALIEGVMGS